MCTSDRIHAYVVEHLERRTLLSGQLFPGERIGTPGMFPAADATDINGDGLLDLVTVKYGISVLLGFGDGTFAAPVTSAIAGYAHPTLGDFTNDGKIDVVAITGMPGTMTNALVCVPGNGDGSFGAPIYSSFTGNPFFLINGDFTGEGNLDLAI